MSVLGSCVSGYQEDGGEGLTRRVGVVIHDLVVLGTDIPLGQRRNEGQLRALIANSTLGGSTHMFGEAGDLQEDREWDEAAGEDGQISFGWKRKGSFSRTGPDTDKISDKERKVGSKRC